MNNRIFELAKQADLIQWDALPSGAITPDHASVVKAKKFAELIVRECARISNEVDYTMTNQGAASAQAFMEHFGVEE